MNALVDEFLDSIKEKAPTEKAFETAIELLKVCHGYIEKHYKEAVYGEYQKKLIDVIGEFLKENDRQ